MLHYGFNFLWMYTWSPECQPQPPDEHAPEPIYPGVIWEGHTWNRDTLREFYQPWREVEAAGASVHIGEFGCYN